MPKDCQNYNLQLIKDTINRLETEMKQQEILDAIKEQNIILKEIAASLKKVGAK